MQLPSLSRLVKHIFLSSKRTKYLVKQYNHKTKLCGHNVTQYKTRHHAVIWYVFSVINKNNFSQNVRIVMEIFQSHNREKKKDTLACGKEKERQHILAKEQQTLIIIIVKMLLDLQFTFNSLLPHCRNKSWLFFFQASSSFLNQFITFLTQCSVNTLFSR